MNDMGAAAADMQNRAHALLQGGRPEEARAIGTELCRLFPAEPDHWALLSTVHGMLGELEAAAHCCRRALELQPQHTGARLTLGNILFHQDRADDALDEYRAVLARFPEHGGAHNRMGTVLCHLKRYDAAEASFRAALRADDANAAEGYCNLADLCLLQGRHDEATTYYQRALQGDAGNVQRIKRRIAMLKADGTPAHLAELLETLCRSAPDDPEAWHHLGIVCAAAGEPGRAERALRRALELRPDYAAASINLSNVLYGIGRRDEAITWTRAAIRHRPNHGPAHCNLGHMLAGAGCRDEAVASYEESIRLDPTAFQAYYGLGKVLEAEGALAAAEENFRHAARLQPTEPEIHDRLGTVQYRRTMFDESVQAFRTAIELAPHHGEYWNNLGAALQRSGDLEGAAAAMEEAVRLEPGLVAGYANLMAVRAVQGRPDLTLELCETVRKLDGDGPDIGSIALMSMHYLPRYSTPDIAAAARDWARDFVPSAPPRRHGNIPDGRRRLRIGYVSGDFMNHPVGYFMAPILESHDRAAVAVHCYYNHTAEDDYTARLRAASDAWWNTSALGDEALAERIIQDGIDILVDLSGHTGRNRLTAFALKPAPVQVTWLGYLATTGLAAMDYIFADRYVIPEGDEQYYAEQVVRLPHPYCGLPDFPGPLDVSSLPAATAGRITFGAFHNPAKLGPAVIDCWSRLLHAVPDARLCMNYKWFGDAGVQRDFAAAFAARGITPERLSFSGYAPRRELLAAYGEVDIALDPFPYNGGTTTFEALWMGVPVVSMRGERFAGRVGASILAAAGHEDWVASDEQSYVDKAVTLASDTQRLQDVRRGLRHRLQSPSFSPTAFTRALEERYRQVWSTWCTGVSDAGRS